MSRNRIEKPQKPIGRPHQRLLPLAFLGRFVRDTQGLQTAKREEECGLSVTGKAAAACAPQNSLKTLIGFSPGLAAANEEEIMFHDRTEAGRLLAQKLTEYSNRCDVLVLALPRGGVVVAFEVAQAIHAPLDVFVVRKLGTPGQEELAMGAIATGGIRILHDDVVESLRISENDIAWVTAREQEELERREMAYRGGRPFPDVHGRTVILVDDGIATGTTMRAALAALKKQSPAHLVVAVPVAARSTYEELKTQGEQLICALTPELFFGIGQWYARFPQTSDNEVRDLLTRAETQLTARSVTDPSRGS